MEIWKKTEGFNLADGTPCTVEEVHTRYPFTRDGTIVLERLANGNVGGIDDLAILRQVYAIAPELDDDEAIAAIEVIRSTPPAPVINAAEAKLDYLIMMSE